eukprot:gene33617-39131_t
MVRRIYLPALLPALSSGLRLGLGVTVVGCLLSEIKLSNRGLGFMAMGFYKDFNIAAMLAVLLVVRAQKPAPERLTSEIDVTQKPEQPVASNDTRLWGSDVIADMLRALGLKYVALNPGASFRGLHDSLVNRLGNEDPQMLLCLHEESAVALAHGFAKVTDEPMAAIVHSNVGLMHATMAVFNAWCDRTPLLLIGATGPVDAARRRPWIDWIHTAKDQGALIRNYTKWDDQPASVPAAIESLLRAWQITASAPHGPTYVCLDAVLPEMSL